MYLQIKILILSLLNSFIQTKIEVPQFNDQFVLQEYLSKTYIGPSRIYNTVGITGLTKNYTTFIGNWFISTILKDYAVVIANYGYDIDNLYVAKTKYIFSFINDITRVDAVLQNIRHYSFYAESACVQFVIGQPYYGDSNWLNETIFKMWTDSFINFVLVLTHHGHISVIGYNPFTDTLLNYSESYWSGKSLFPNKFDNLYGYTINVALYPDYPRNILDDDKPYRGEDINTLHAMTKQFNITFNVIMYETYEEILDVLRNYSADVCMNKFFVKSNEDNVTYSYPIFMDDIMICTPKGKEIPFYLYMFFTFDEHLWVGLIVAFVTVISISTAIKVIYGTRIIKAIVKSTNFVFRILFSVPLNTKDWLSITISGRILYMFWIFFSLIMCASFTSSFMKMLVTNKYESDLKTLQDLYNSEYDVYTFPYIQKILQNDSIIGSRVVKALRANIVQMIEDRDIAHSYATPNSFIKDLVKQKNINGRSIFTKLGEILMPGYSVYVFQFKSPFIKLFDDFLIYNKEYGLSSYRTEFIADGERLSENRNIYQPLEFHHLQGAFMILICGYCLGILMFFAEILMKNKVIKARGKELRMNIVVD